MSGPSPAPATPKRWGAPLQRLDARWTAVERRLATWVLLAEIGALVVWVALKSLATGWVPAEAGGSDNPIGLIFRSAFGALLLAVAAHLVTRRAQRTPTPAETSAIDVRNAVAVSGAALLGLALGPVWGQIGDAWATNVVEWLQNSSALTLIGGPRGLVTRLTLWVALLGASMAASKGKHINIDLATRFLPARAVVPVASLGWLVAAAVAFAATWGFVDSICVTKFRAEAFTSCADGQGSLCDTKVASRLATMQKGASSDFFMLRRQLGLDLRTLPHVLAGEAYDGWLDAPTWNAWVRDGGWEEHFPKESVTSMALGEDDPTLRKMPAVVAPDSGEGRDLLIRDLDLILPFGLLVVGLKFLLRMLRVWSGQVHLDPDAAHDDEDLKAGHTPDGHLAAAR